MEIRISDASFGAEMMLNYQIHLTLRLCKVMYVDYTNFGKIGEQ